MTCDSDLTEGKNFFYFPISFWKQQAIRQQLFTLPNKRQIYTFLTILLNLSLYIPKLPQNQATHLLASTNMSSKRISIRVIDISPINTEESFNLAISQLPLLDFKDSAPLSKIVSLGKFADSNTNSRIHCSEKPLKLASSTIVPLEKLSNSTSRSNIIPRNFSYPTLLSSNSCIQKILDLNLKLSRKYSGEYHFKSKIHYRAFISQSLQSSTKPIFAGFIHGGQFPSRASS
jgi:hypothetical protein